MRRCNKVQIALVSIGIRRTYRGGTAQAEQAGALGGLAPQAHYHHTDG